MRPKAERPGGPARPARTAKALRRLAEEVALGRAAESPEDLAAMSREEVGQVLHELRVHQIELEMQNEELRRTQVELDAARARYFDLYDLAPVGYVTLSERGSILRSNLTAATMLGANRGGLARQSLSGFFIPEDADAYFLHCKKLLADGEPQSFDLRMVRPDRSTAWMRFEMRLAADAESRKPEIRATFTDVTAEHRAAEERQLQVQLAQAEKLESVGRLAGGIAHDFNNMLTVILGYVELALSEVDPADPLHDDLDTIRSAGQRSAELTAQLLAFARQEVRVPRAVDLNEVVATELRMLDRLLGEPIELVWRPATDLWATLVDPRQVGRVLSNLCINARDAIDGRGRIEIATANVVFGEGERPAPAGHRPGEWVMLSVRDTGRGMSADVMEHVFEPLFTTKDIAAGSGLGLATVHGIASQNGGFVDIASRPGERSTFSVYLPRTPRPVDLPERRGPGELRLGAGETVLLVEDEVPVLQLIGEQLGRLGYVVLSAGSLGEAVRAAEAHDGEIDLILSDVVLPESTGSGLMEQLGRSQPRAGRLLMSGHPEHIASEESSSGEPIPLLAKPFSLDQLAAAVGAALDVRPPVAAADGR